MTGKASSNNVLSKIFHTVATLFAELSILRLSESLDITLSLYRLTICYFGKTHSILELNHRERFLEIITLCSGQSKRCLRIPASLSMRVAAFGGDLVIRNRGV